jgi:hypothetical protein
MLVETVSANPREPHRFEAIDQNRLLASSLENRCHYLLFLRWNEPWRPFEWRREHVQAPEHAAHWFGTPQRSGLRRCPVGSLRRRRHASAIGGSVRACVRSAGCEPVVSAVAKKRAVGAWEWLGSSRRVRPPHTSDGAAAFDAGRDLLEMHAKIRVRMPQPRVLLVRLLVFTLNGHITVIGFAPEKVARATWQPP